MSRRGWRPRRGWMLMEAVIVMSALSLIMAAGVSLIAAVRKTHHAVTVDAANGRALDSLARDFRRDLQRATSVEPGADPKDTRLTIIDVGQNRIEYVSDVAGIQRNAETQGGDVSREIFRLRGNPRVTWTIFKSHDEGPVRLPPRVFMDISLRSAEPADPAEPPRARTFRLVGFSPLMATTEERSDAAN